MYVIYLVCIDGTPEIFINHGHIYPNNLGVGSPSESRWIIPGTVSVDD